MPEIQKLEVTSCYLSKAPNQNVNAADRWVDSHFLLVTRKFRKFYRRPDPDSSQASKAFPECSPTRNARADKLRESHSGNNLELQHPVREDEEKPEPGSAEYGGQDFVPFFCDGNKTYRKYLWPNLASLLKSQQIYYIVHSLGNTAVLPVRSESDFSLTRNGLGRYWTDNMGDWCNQRHTFCPEETNPTKGATQQTYYPREFEKVLVKATDLSVTDVIVFKLPVIDIPVIDMDLTDLRNLYSASTARNPAPDPGVTAT
ncbi:hypothetical protein B0H19DRAFT_1321057 [Mycena capillaripes]|nr:hypothetical protein B0H19DRAFT_1321057 [Mycena capillaripes]